jgi:hypothetical protein
MRIGIDFDNTIVCYDNVFSAAARQLGFVEASWTVTKTQLRNWLRAQNGGEAKWQRLQGHAYGSGIMFAAPFPGIIDFLDAAAQRNADVFVVSHKTQYGHKDKGRTDLREAARKWMIQTGLLREEGGLKSDRIFFEDDLEAKVKRIAALDLDVFIDDLPEVFLHRAFPPAVTQILFGLKAFNHCGREIRAVESWERIRSDLFS